MNYENDKKESLFLNEGKVLTQFIILEAAFLSLLLSLAAILFNNLSSLNV